MQTGEEIKVNFGDELGLVSFGNMPEEQVRQIMRERGQEIRNSLIARRQAELASKPVPDMVRDEALQSGRVVSGSQSLMRRGGEAVGGSASWLARLGDAVGAAFAGMDPSGTGLAIPSMEVAIGAEEELKRREARTPLQREAEIQSDPLYQFGKEIRSGAQEAYQPNPAYKGEFLADVIPSSLGGMVPTVAASIFGGPLVAAAQYGSAAGQDAAEEAIAAGRPDLAQTAAMVNAPIGAVTEAILGPAANIAKYVRLAGGGAGRALLRGAGSEAVQEGLEQVGSNLAARGVGVDPNRELTQGVGESMAAGAVLGGLAGGGAAGARQAGQALQDRLAPDFSLTPPLDENPMTPPPEWFNRQAEVQQAATVAIQSLDQQIAQANPQTPLEANVLVAQNAAQKMEVLNQYLEAQRNLAQQAQAAIAPPAASSIIVDAPSDPLSGKPSAQMPARAATQAPPRPPREGRSTAKRDLWDETYGDMRRGGRTHNDDGTPYQPTILDETMQEVNLELSQDPEASFRIVGVGSSGALALRISDMINAGWVWDPDQKRMVNPAAPSQAPHQFGQPAPTSPALPPEPQAQQVSPLPPTTAGSPSAPIVSTFTTSKGSEYSLDANGNTTRFKKSPGKGQGVVHEAMPAVFISPQGSDAILNEMNVRTIIAEQNPDGSFTQLRPAFGERISDSGNLYVLAVSRVDGRIQAAVKATTKPAIGLHPFEIAYRGDQRTTHLGNQITELNPAAPSQVASASSVATKAAAPLAALEAQQASTIPAAPALPPTPEAQPQQAQAASAIQGAPPIASYGVMAGSGSEGDRVFVSVPVNGVPMLFYRSSKGTSGKQAGKWYPAFGIAAGDWIVKGRVPDMERGYDIPEVKAVMDGLNASFPGTVEETVAALSPILGNPVGARQIASLTYGPRGIDRRVGQNDATGVNQRIREVLNAVMEARPQQSPVASTEPQYQPFPPISGDQLPRSASAVQAAAPLAALEAQQATTFPVAPMAQAQEPAPALLNQSVIDQLRAARQRDELARAEVQAASTLPETTTESTPVDQFVLNRQPATQDALFVVSSDAGVFRPEASQPELQVGLPQVGQGDAQVPAAGQVQEEAVAPARYTPEQLQNLARNIRNYGWNPAEFGLTAEDVDRLSPPKPAEAAQPANPTVTSGQKVVRYVVEGKGGLMNRDAFDISKLTESQVGKLEELLTYGLQQPRGVPGGAVFYFTEAGEEANKKLLALLKKAAKGKVVRTTHSAQDTPLWVSTDGQVAFEREQPKFGRREPSKSAAPEPQAKTDFDARRVKWAESPIIQGLNDLTPAEASRVVDEANGVEPTAPPTSKTELARFIREARRHIDSGAGGLAEDIRPAAFQAERNRLMDAVMRDVIRNFESDGGPDAWRYDFAWKRAFVPIGGKAVVKREMTSIRETERFADLKTQIPTEVTTDEGDTVSTIDKPELQKQQSPAELLSDSISVFVANNNLSAEDAIALKLRVAKERNPDLYEEHVSGLDEDQAADTREMVDSKRTTQLYRKLLPSIREYLSSISGPITVAMDKASVEQALASAFGSLPNLTVIEDPNHTLPNGQSGRNVAAYINLPTGQITVNAAYIDTPTRAVEAVLEEGVHAAWEDPAVQAAWGVVKARVDQAKLDAQIARGYSPEVALEEAAVADVLAYLKENRVGGPIENFLTTLWSRLKALFGIGNQYDQSRNQILQKALEALQGSRAVTAQQDAEYMAAVEAGDTATAQRMVDEAAKRAGYTIGPVYHGTPRAGFNQFDPSQQGRLDEGFLGRGFYFSGSPDVAWIYAEIPKGAGKEPPSGLWRQRTFAGRTGRVGKFFLSGNLLKIKEQIIGRRERDRTEVIREALNLPILATASEVTDQAIQRGFNGVLYTSRFGGEEYAIFNPSQIKSAEAVVRDANGNVIPLSARFNSFSPDLRYSRENPQSDRIVRSFSSLLEAARQNEPWRTWYATYQAELESLFGSDTETFRDFLAATSQATGVAGNVSLALKAYRQWINGEAFTGYLPAVAMNLEKAASKVALAGAKISQYQAANTGDTTGVAVDRHIVELLFNRTGTAPNAAQIAKAKAVIGRIAEELGWEPRQVQAALWAHNQIRKGATPQSYDTYLRKRADEIAALRASADAARAGGGIPARPQPQQSGGPDLRLSRNNGVFLSRTQAQSAISQAQEVGGDVSTIAQVAQVEGELVPRQTVSDVESLASSKSKVERIASRFLAPLKAIGDLADQTWLAPFTRFYPTARSASEAGSASELAAEAVVRADLALKAKAKAVKERLAKAEMALLEAVDNLPRAVAADSDAQINKAEGEALISEMEKALANELTAARAVDVPDAEIQASILRASRILSEARKDIGSGIGSALTAIARELPPQITDEAAILNWVEQRLNNKSLPPLMSEAVRSFLTTPLYKARTAPIQRIQLAPLIAKLRAITATKEAAKAELEQFKKDFHQGRVSKGGKPLNVSVKAFAKRFAGFEEKYKAALALSREINAKVSRAQDYVDALRLADEKFAETFELLSYRQKLEDAVKISNAGSGSLKILIGDDGQLNGTVSIPNPLTKKIEVVDLSPLAFKRQETQAKLNELAILHEQALTDPETDPYDRIQLARNLTQIQRMQDAGLRSATNLVDMIPASVPFFGGMTYIPMSRLHHDAPWFGKRLSAPNNVVTWVSGAAGKQVAGIMAATDIAAAQLERLRSDSDPSKPSQTKINDLTVTSMKAHDMDPQNAENQSRISSHFSEIISQAQRPEQRPFRVGDTNPVTKLPVLKEDIAAVEAMKQWGTAVYKVGQRAKPDSIARNIAERPVQQTEVISGKSVSRIAADYGLKLPRQADVSKLPIVRDWVNATEPQKLVILEENFPTIVTGMVTETDPDFTSRFDAVDRKIFNEAMLLGRAGNLPFQDVDSFLTWWSNQRAAETGLTPAEELADAQKNLLKYVNGFMGVFGEYAGVGQKSDLTTADREVRNTPDSLMTIATADNQFTRPRGTLLAPSTFYSYDLTGIGAQEGLKTNLLNVFHHEHIKAWINVKSALKAAMETFDRRKREMVAKGMSESKARRILQAESRKKSASIANEADYATIRNVVGHIEAMVSEMTRVATERLSVPEDAPLMRSGKAAVGLSGAVLLQSSAAIINNATGGAYGSAVIDSWLNRTHGLAAGPQALAALTKNAFARIVGTAGRKVGWFGKWLQSNGAVANALADMVAEATYRRQLAEDALTVDAPDTKAMIKARLALPGSGGVVDPGRTDPVFSRILNQLQSGMGIAEVKKTVPAYLHPVVDALATGATALPEYTKRLFPSAVDRMINTTTGYMYRTWVEDPAIKSALFNHWSRKEALGGNWDSPSNPDFQFSNDDIGEALPSQSRKLLSDILAPIGSLERLSLAWYNRAKGMTSAERAAEPILTKDQADQVEFEFLKLTNQRAESTTPQVMKGKGLGGLVRSIFWQFARYGANHTAVIQRRFAKLSGGQDDENKWLAGLCLALVLALLGATGLELKGIMKIFEGDARTTPTLTQAGTDPEAALRYMAASITPFLHPTGTEVVQSLVGGQTQTTPFDITQKVPVLGQATAFAKAAKTAWQTGDIGYPTADFLRNALPISKFVINALMPGDAARREAARAVRAAAPSDIELREFAGGLGGKATPMTPLIRDAINSAMEGDTAEYNKAVEKAVAYQMSTGKDRKAATKAVESAIAAKDPIQSVVGRTLTPQDESRILSRMSSRQRTSFLRARSITSGIRSRRSLLGRSRKPRSLLRQRRKKTKRTRLA